MGMPPPMGVPPQGGMMPYQDTPLNPFAPFTWPIAYLIGFLFYKTLVDIPFFAGISGYAAAAGAAGTAVEMAIAIIPAVLIYFWVFQPILNKLLTGYWQP